LKEEKELEIRLRRLLKRIEELESTLKEKDLVINGILEELRLLRNISSISANILRTASYITRYKYGDLHRHIVTALLSDGPMNISQLTLFLRNVRGTASRRIVSEKIKLLDEHGIIEEVSGKKSEKRYRIREKRK